ncbi:MAG TPA: DedA family protein [Streptosporangiaceae bacterium]
MGFVGHALGWVTTLPSALIYAVVAVALAAETGLLVGVLLPAEPLLLLVGYLVSTGRLSLVTAILVTTAAALAGDWLAYLAGRRLGPRLDSGRLGRVVGPHRWSSAGRLFARHGGFAVTAGRCTAFVRTLTPRMAGAVRLRPVRFAVWDLMAVAVWVPGSVLAGDLAGASYARLADRVSHATLGVLAAVAAVAVVAFLVLRHRRRRASALPVAEEPPVPVEAPVR